MTLPLILKPFDLHALYQGDERRREALTIGCPIPAHVTFFPAEEGTWERMCTCGLC